MSLIELKNITFQYSETEEAVFTNFSLSISSGECLIVKGDNGSGKSTLFRILNGLSFLQEGHYLFDGTKITRHYLKDNTSAKRFHKRIGFLFQNPDIMLFNANVYNEIAFGPRQMGFSDEKINQIVTDCLEVFQITELSQKAPYHLSGGQKKRVAFAAVMALNPEIVILDEPYAGLDKKSAIWLTEFLFELKKAGKTLIIATHQEATSKDLADRVLDLNEA